VLATRECACLRNVTAVHFVQALSRAEAGSDEDRASWHGAGKPGGRERVHLRLNGATNLCVRRDWYFQNCFLKVPGSASFVFAGKIRYEPGA
jgi:hypothetical protein